MVLVVRQVREVLLEKASTVKEAKTVKVSTKAAAHRARADPLARTVKEASTKAAGLLAKAGLPGRRASTMRRRLGLTRMASTAQVSKDGKGCR